MRKKMCKVRWVSFLAVGWILSGRKTEMMWTVHGCESPEINRILVKWHCNGLY